MAGFKTVGQCEWAEYPTKVLEKHWPAVPRWRDIRTLTGDSFYEKTGLRTVDIISGGFPCQPFSHAGEQRGKNDDRYLWPEMFRIIQELRPAWVVGENVANIKNLALDDVLFDLESQGYKTRAFMVSARGVGALHRRDRFAIVAHSDSNGLKRTGLNVQKGCEWDQINAAISKDKLFERAERGTKPGLGGVVDGIPSWMDRYWVEDPGIPKATKKRRIGRKD